MRTALDICPAFERCGGCPLLGKPSTEQRALKTERVLTALSAAEVTAPDSIEWVTDRTLGYRDRLRLKVEPDGQVAFFNSDKHGRCAVLSAGLVSAIQHLRDVAQRAPALFAPYAHLEVRGPDQRGRASVYLTPRSADPPDCRELGETLGPGFLLGVSDRSEAPRQLRQLSPGAFALVPLGSFWQVHEAVNRKLVGCVVAAAKGHTSFLDLYAGAGNFALPLAHAGLHGVAVERDAQALRALADAAREQHLTGLASRQGEVGTVGASLDAAEFVIADPPRGGLKSAVRWLPQLCRQRLLVVSCYPESLARDLAALRGAFQLSRLTLFDMFPQTAHVEVVAELSR